MFSKKWFLDLDDCLRKQGLDSDNQSFDEILGMLRESNVCSPDEFAGHCIYVILAGGFSQKTAKKIYHKILEIIKHYGSDFDVLINVFNNKNKINAICKIWNNRRELCDGYYKLNTLDEKLKYLQNLPHIGKITANHLARNLGEDVVKYDIWIQRLGVVFSGNKDLFEKIDNGHLNDEIKKVCDDMFAHLVRETNLPRGYIDVVLWKSCQQGMIKL